MYRQLRIAVVIPAFNEEAAITDVVANVPSFVDRIVVVDDASRDRTSAHAKLASAEVVVLRHKSNRGVGAAIVSGYKDAAANGMDVAVVMAGDGQMDPSDLPSLLDPIATGRADYVKGNRFAHRELFLQMPPIRVLGNTLLSVATKFTSGYRHTFDSQCGYTAIRTDTLAKLDLDQVFPRYGYPNDMLAHLHGVRARVVDVPVRPIYGPTWKSGVKWHTAVYPVGFVLLKSWLIRVRNERNSDDSLSSVPADPAVDKNSSIGKSRASGQP